jgi:hypothetical protein
MKTEKLHIDPYLFEQQFEAFKQFVEEKSVRTFFRAGSLAAKTNTNRS